MKQSQSESVHSTMTGKRIQLHFIAKLLTKKIGGTQHLLERKNMGGHRNASKKYWRKQDSIKQNIKSTTKMVTLHIVEASKILFIFDSEETFIFTKYYYFISISSISSVINCKF